MSATRPPAFDDRFTTPIEASRRGAHRARPKPVSAGLPVVAGVIVVLAVLGGVYTLVGNRDSSSPTSAGESLPGSDPVPSAAVSASAAATTDPATDPTTDPAAADPTTTEPSAPASTTAAGGDSGSGADKSLDVIVLNSGKVKGLAKRLGSTLASNGWKVPRTGNSVQHSLITTKIYYGDSSQEATASALKDEIGFGTVVQDSSVVKAAKGLVIVLGKDAE